jgi:hypothetical protein
MFEVSFVKFNYRAIDAPAGVLQGICNYKINQKHPSLWWNNFEKPNRIKWFGYLWCAGRILDVYDRIFRKGEHW